MKAEEVEKLLLEGALELEKSKAHFYAWLDCLEYRSVTDLLLYFIERKDKVLSTLFKEIDEI